ncbi:ABC transporter permease [Bacteroidota bacterium]
MFRILSYNFRIASEALFQNKLRSMLTSLGIICGVASVIAMLAIGKGAQQEILEKMKLLGTNNIIIKPLDEEDKQQIIEDSEESDNEKQAQAKKYSPGLNLQDAESIKRVIPEVKSVSPEIIMESLALRHGFKRNVNLVGILISYFDINLFDLSEGNFFSDHQIQNSLPVCIIGSGIKTKLFAGDNPVGKSIKCGNNWLTVVGVIQERNISKENIQNLGIRDFNYDIYIPITTMLLRYKNRSLITKRDLASNRRRSSSNEDEGFNQLDRLVVEVKDSKHIKATSEIISRMLNRRHHEVIDYEIIVPELLLEQEQSTRRIFNIVLGAIASISLIVGGIGIMNIMLASVMERTKEIGIRRAVGAKQNDILIQFLIEAVTISISGGVIGIIGGVVLSYLIESATEIITIISALSVFVSFIVSISVGLIFGITPARKASLQDPIDLLRYE